ncbi:MAG TPA: hypothetical protein VFA18_00180, partial [Gemmataceae bacterium]|nr:hypothetical protein [Gemmataceae bacterium]
CVCIGWVFFRAPTFAAAATLLGRMAHPTVGARLDPTLTAGAISLLLLVLVCHLLASSVDLGRLQRRLPVPAAGAALAMILTAALFLLPENAQAFIYFQF